MACISLIWASARKSGCFQYIGTGANTGEKLFFFCLKSRAGQHSFLSCRQYALPALFKLVQRAENLLGNQSLLNPDIGFCLLARKRRLSRTCF